MNHANSRVTAAYGSSDDAPLENSIMQITHTKIDAYIIIGKLSNMQSGKQIPKHLLTSQHI
jgi:hypothetical protein